MATVRTESDFLGTVRLPLDALYGVHTARAVENFPLSNRRVNRALIHAYGSVKLACAETNCELGHWNATTFDAIATACREMAAGELDEHIVVDALQGGAGTSTNMNVNEVLANRALQVLGEELGTYTIVHPIEDINLHQSTNDTYPTALKIAAITLLRELEKTLVNLLTSFQSREKEMAHVVKVGRTQMQDAVLTTMGRTMAAFAEAFGRDRWRVFKCEERLRVVNLGGTAIGTGLTAPRRYIFKVVEKLKQNTTFGVARAENLVDATQNNDEFVEVSGILSACASNLLKVAGDIRFMSSGPDAGIGELILPSRQAGSSIMPGKVNPVIPEAVSQAAMRVISNHSMLTQAVSMGNLELNSFMPLIADALLESLELLKNACHILRSLCVDGICVDELRCKENVSGSASVLTVLVDSLGYEAAGKLGEEAVKLQLPIRALVIEKGILSGEEFDELISAESVTKLGTRQA